MIRIKANGKFVSRRTFAEALTGLLHGNFPNRKKNIYMRLQSIVLVKSNAIFFQLGYELSLFHPTFSIPIQQSMFT